MKNDFFKNNECFILYTIKLVLITNSPRLPALVDNMHNTGCLAQLCQKEENLGLQILKKKYGKSRKKTAHTEILNILKFVAFKNLR